MRISRVGIGGSLSPELEKAQGLVDFQNPEGSLEFLAYCYTLSKFPLFFVCPQTYSQVQLLRQDHIWRSGVLVLLLQKPLFRVTWT